MGGVLAAVWLATLVCLAAFGFQEIIVDSTEDLLIEECEADLPRSVHCELIAVPIQNDLH